MTDLQLFILGILVILAAAGAWRRWLEYRLKKQFMTDQKDHLQGKIDERLNEFFNFKREED